MILVKIRYSGENNIENYKTLAPLRRVSYNDLEIFYEYLSERLGLLIDSYEPTNIHEIIFSYVIKNDSVSKKDKLLLSTLTYGEENENKKLIFHNFNKIKLPISMNPKDYGIILSSSIIDEGAHAIQIYITTINRRVFQIDVSIDNAINNVTILGASDLKWTDTQLGEDNYFKREIGKTIIYFLKGKIVLKKYLLNAKPFRKG